MWLALHAEVVREFSTNLTPWEAMALAQSTAVQRAGRRYRKGKKLDGSAKLRQRETARAKGIPHFKIRGFKDVCKQHTKRHG